MMFTIPAVFAALALGTLSSPAVPQGTREDSASRVELRQRFGPLYSAPRFDLAWSPDGSRALYLESAGKGSASSVCAIDLNSGATTELAPPGDSPAYERIAFRATTALLWSPASTTVTALPAGGGPPTEQPLAETPEFLVDSTLSKAARDRGPVGVDFVLHNLGPEPVELLWINGAGKPQAYATIASGDRHRQSSYSTHHWEVTRAGQRLGEFFVPSSPAAAVVDAGGLITAPDDRPQALPGDRKTGREPGTRKLRATETGLALETFDERGRGTRVPLEGRDLPTAGIFRSIPDPNDRYRMAVRELQPTRREVHYVESSPTDQLQPVLHSYGYRKPGDDLPTFTLTLADLETLTARRVAADLFPQPFALNRFRWAPDGSAFTFHYNERGHQLYRVVRVDPATAEATTLVEERSATFIDYPQKMKLRWLDRRGQFLWMSERSGWNHLELRDAATGELVRPLTSGDFVVRGIERVDEAAGQVWIRVSGVREGEDPYHVHLARVDLDTAEFTLLTDGDGTHRFEFSPGGGTFVDTYSRVDLAPVTELRDAHTGALLAELARASTAALEAAGWRAPRRFEAPGRDGTTPIWGIVHLPTHYDPARSYPIIEAIYAGPHGAHVPKEFGVVRGPNHLAELGFIVVQIDGMGTNHRGKAFHDVAWKNLADAGFPDRRVWIEAAAAEIPGMDLTRVGIYGGSAGGQNALGALLSHGDFYDVAVSDCGCHDNRVDKMWWNELWMGWPIGPHYEEQSNVTRAHLLTGKLLLIVGEMDENVDPASTMQVVDALIRADKDFDLLVMPGVGHGAAGTPYGTRRLRDFFVRHLLDREPR